MTPPRTPSCMAPQSLNFQWVHRALLSPGPLCPPTLNSCQNQPPREVVWKCSQWEVIRPRQQVPHK